MGSGTPSQSGSFSDAIAHALNVVEVPDSLSTFCKAEVKLTVSIPS